MERQLLEAAKQAGEVEDMFQSWLLCKVKTPAQYRNQNHMWIWLVSFDEWRLVVWHCRWAMKQRRCSTRI
jgi:hypothetical protein